MNKTEQSNFNYEDYIQSLENIKQAVTQIECTLKRHNIGYKHMICTEYDLALDIYTESDCVRQNILKPTQSLLDEMNKNLKSYFKNGGQL